MPRKKAKKVPAIDTDLNTPIEDDGTDILGEIDESAGEEVTSDTPRTAASQSTHKNPWEYRASEQEYDEQKRALHAERLSQGLYAAALRDGNTIQSVIASVDVSDTNAYWICYDSNALIRIPLEEAFENLDDDFLSDATPSKMKRTFLEGSIGATVTYVVTDLEFDENRNIYLVTGSRVQAQKRIRRRYFGASAVKPMQVGDIVSAQVISSGDFSCYVEFNGVISRLANKDISYRLIPSVRDMYPGGTKIDVMILAIDGTDENPEVVVSGIRVEKMRLKERHWRVSKGMTTTATVKAVRLNNEADPPVINIAMYLDEAELPAYANSVRRDDINVLTRGTRVSVCVESINMGTGFVRVRIKHILD